MNLLSINVKEDDLLKVDRELLQILLIDRTKENNKIKEKNIIWATDNYKKYGSSYAFEKQIKIELITAFNKNIIKPRIEKSKEEQQKRSREKAEVFTPSWIVNNQNNLIDEAWFERKNVFNIEENNSWKTNLERIQFENDKKTWKDYVSLTRLEVSCGEAPYLTSRYDATTGEFIEVKKRVGLLDRKLRIVNENTENKEDWIKWATVSVQNVYGFDWQGDNVFIARENVLFTIIEHYFDKFNEKIDDENLVNFAKIISWNIWQMDGIKFVVPNSCVATKKTDEQFNLFDFGFEEDENIECEGCKKNNHLKHTGIYCKIKDWGKNKIIRFVDVVYKKI